MSQSVDRNHFTSVIEVIDPGRLTTIQDRGRAGLERFGIPPGGAADWFSAEVANRLVGNDQGAALLEFTGGGPALRFHDEALIALTGAAIERHPFDGDPRWRTHRIPARTVIGFGRLGPGLRGYMSVRGGIDVPRVLGSRSLCQRGDFGGGFGRPLRQGDPLPVGTMIAAEPLARSWPAGHRLSISGPWEVRVIAGPHLDAFSSGALDRLTSVACLVTPAVDRMGLRIETPGVRIRGKEILTTPVTAGSIQVTPSGELIVLLADHPTTGGYPVIATTIHADLACLAQARPGDTIRFGEVDLFEAQRALHRLEGWLDVQ